MLKRLAFALVFVALIVGIFAGRNTKSPALGIHESDSVSKSEDFRARRANAQQLFKDRGLVVRQNPNNPNGVIIDMPQIGPPPLPFTGNSDFDRKRCIELRKLPSKSLPQSLLDLAASCDSAGL